MQETRMKPNFDSDRVRNRALIALVYSMRLSRFSSRVKSAMTGCATILVRVRKTVPIARARCLTG